MSAIHEVYCQTEFLSGFTMKGVPEEESKQMTRLRLRQLLMNESSLILNKPFAELKTMAENNPYIKALIKASVSGGSQIVDMTDEQFQDQVLSTEAACLLDPRSLLLHEQASSDQYDRLQLLNMDNRSCLDRAERYFRNKSYFLSVDPDKLMFHGWDTLKRIQLPVTDIVIADRYLFGIDSKSNDNVKTSNYYSKNLLAILTNVIPDHCDKIFNISMFTYLDGGQDRDARVTRIESGYKILSEALLSFKRNFEIRLEVCFLGRVDSFRHDRDIVTNYYWVSSGPSIEYYDHRGRLKANCDGDSLTITSLGQCRETSDLILGKLKEHKATALAKDQVFGSNSNRLL